VNGLAEVVVYVIKETGVGSNCYLLQMLLLMSPV